MCVIRNRIARFVVLRATLLAWLAAIAIGPFAAPAAARAAASLSLTIGQMSTGRSGYAMAVLQSGRVLIAGGSGGIATIPPILDTAEIYGPSTNRFSMLAHSMTVPRDFHTASLLKNGSVLITGGRGLRSE